MHKFLFLTLFTFLFSQAEITNIQASQRTDGSQIVDITYDLLEDDLFTTFDIIAQFSIDNGITFTNINYAGGAIGSLITPGSSKTISWEMGNQLPNIFFDNVIIKIIAESTIINDFPFDLVTILTGTYEYICGDIQYNDITVSDDIKIMDKEVTNAQYAEFLITLYNNGELTINDIEDGGAGEYVIFYEGDAYFEPGYYIPHVQCMDVEGDSNGISWNGTTFIVSEGYGDIAVNCVSYIGAKYFADYYGARLPLQSELETAVILNVIDDPKGECSEEVERLNEVLGETGNLYNPALRINCGTCQGDMYSRNVGIYDQAFFRLVKN